MSDTIQNYVSGALVDSSATDFIELIDPSTGLADGRSPISTPGDVDGAFRVALAASKAWKRTTPRARQLALLQIADAVAVAREELVELQARDTGQIKAHIASFRSWQGPVGVRARGVHAGQTPHEQHAGVKVTGKNATTQDLAVDHGLGLRA